MKCLHDARKSDFCGICGANVKPKIATVPRNSQVKSWKATRQNSDTFGLVYDDLFPIFAIGVLGCGFMSLVFWILV